MWQIAMAAPVYFLIVREYDCFFCKSTITQSFCVLKFCLYLFRSWLFLAASTQIVRHPVTLLSPGLLIQEFLLEKSNQNSLELQMTHGSELMKFISKRFFYQCFPLRLPVYHRFIKIPQWLPQSIVLGGFYAICKIDLINATGTRLGMAGHVEITQKPTFYTAFPNIHLHIMVWPRQFRQFVTFIFRSINDWMM